MYILGQFSLNWLQKTFFINFQFAFKNGDIKDGGIIFHKCYASSAKNSFIVPEWVSRYWKLVFFVYISQFYIFSRVRSGIRSWWKRTNKSRIKTLRFFINFIVSSNNNRLIAHRFFSCISRRRLVETSN
jgi:hypothetical protein